MKKLALSILLSLTFTVSHAQNNWSFLQNKDLSAGIGIQSSDYKTSLNYLKKESRNQLLIISKENLDCLVCSLQFNFSKRTVNADAEYLYKTANNEYVYMVLNKVGVLRGFSYSDSFTMTNLKNRTNYKFNGNVPIKYFNISDFSEWKYQNGFYETDSLNYYRSKSDLLAYAKLSGNKKLSGIQTLYFNGININCNPACEITSYFASGPVVYKMLREDNLGTLVYRLPHTFLKDMQDKNKGKDSFAIVVNTLERGNLMFKFDSSTYNPSLY